MNTAMAEYKPAMPHGDLQEIFNDIFFVTGTTKPQFGGGEWQFSRNMTVVRSDGVLTLINAVRLDDEGLAALEALGQVANVVKLGAFHGMDDRFYVDRYQATQWAMPGMEHGGGQKTDKELTVGGAMPFDGCSLFVFESSSQPEGLLVLDRDGGIVVSCDSLQNWAETDPYFSEETAMKMTAAGFIKPANVGPGWVQSCSPDKSDFARIKELAFKHLIPAHGTVLKDNAHEAFSATFKAAYDV